MFMRDWSEDPDIGAWVNADPDTGIIEIHITGTRLRDGMTVTLGNEEKPYLARVGFSTCLVAGCGCIRDASIQLVPLDSPLCVKDVRRGLVSILKRRSEQLRRRRHGP